VRKGDAGREMVFTTPNHGYFTEAHTLRLGFNVVSVDTQLSPRRLRASDFRSLAVGDMNTFLSSWADHLETEMLHMSKFNTGQN